jgi:hypothetical protein
MNSASKRFILIMASLLLFTTASMSTLAEQGVVLDKATGRPIPGAIVVATWHGVVRTFVEPASQCYKVEVAVADGNGRFDVSSFSWNLNPFMMDRLRGVTVLAPGYGVSSDWDPTSLRILMEPQTRSKSEQFARLPSTYPLGCFGANKAILPYLKTLYAEMLPLATSTDEKMKAANVAFEIDFIEVGEREAHRRSGQRASEIDQGRQ